MRKLTVFIFCMILTCSLFSLTGCSNRTASKKDVAFLTANKYWYHFDEVTGETEKMRFDEEFTFYWGCECGEPVGDSDCYELFDYDKETSMIKLYNGYDDMSMEMELLDYSDYHILLKIDGEIKDYTYYDSGLELADSEKYMSGYSGEFAIIGGNTEEVILGPFDYDGDVDYPDNAKKTYKLAESAEAYTLSAFTYIKDGEVIEDTVEYEELSIEEAAENMEYGGYGIIWFDDNMEVNKVLFYGSTVVEE